MYSKPGILWLSYILIFLTAGLIWLSGYSLLENKQAGNSRENQISYLFPGYIHDTETARIYIHEKDRQTLYAAVEAPVQSFPETEHLQFFEKLDTFSASPENPTFSPILKISPLFNSILDEFSLFKSELSRLYRDRRRTFIVFSIVILSFFIFSGIVMQLSKFPLFIVVILLGLIRLFFYLFALFITGPPAELLELLLSKRIYPPLIGIGYFSLIFFLSSLRNSLVHPRRRRKNNI